MSKVFWQHATNLRYDGLHWNLSDRVSGEVSWQYKYMLAENICIATMLIKQHTFFPSVLFSFIADSSVVF